MPLIRGRRRSDTSAAVVDKRPLSRLTAERLLVNAPAMHRRHSPSFLLLLVALFAFAQQAATLHAPAHGFEASSQQQDKHSPANKVCDKCIVFSQLSGAVASEAPRIEVATAAQQLTGSPHLPAPQRLLAAYRSRAPPTHS
jgi:hypothetical protein